MVKFLSKIAFISFLATSVASAQTPETSKSEGAEAPKTEVKTVAETKPADSKPADTESKAAPKDEVGKAMNREDAPKKKHKKHSRVKIGAEFHGNWNMDLRDEENGGNDIKESTFNVTRMYITAKAKLSSWLTTRTTVDFGYYMGSIPDAKNDPNLAYIKYAYFQAKVAPDQFVLFGTQPRVWVGTMDDIFGYRYVLKSSMDHFKLFDSADTGLAYNGTFMNGMVNVNAGIFNGNGYKDPAPGEDLQNNMIEARVTVKPIQDKASPLSGLGIHLYFGTKGYQVDDGLGNIDDFRANVFGGAISFNHKFVDFMLEAMMIKNGQDGDEGAMVISPYIAVKWEKFAFFANYSMYTDSNLDEDDTWTRIVAGVSWKPKKNFAISLNYQMESNSGHKGDGNDKSAIFVSTMFKY